MQINFKSFIAGLLGERLLHRLKTRVLLLWNASWHDTRLCLLSLGWQLGGRLWALQGSELEEFCGAASIRQGTPVLLEKKSGLDSWQWSGEEGRRMYWGVIQEPLESPGTHGWLLGFLSWLWGLKVGPLSCSPGDLTRGTEMKKLLRDRVEFSSEKACSITHLCCLGFKNYLLQILGQDREEQGRVKIIFTSTLCLMWCAGLATLPLISVWQGKMFTWKHKAQKLPGRKLRGCKISSHLPCAPFCVSSFFLTVCKSCSSISRVASHSF